MIRHRDAGAVHEPIHRRAGPNAERPVSWATGRLIDEDNPVRAVDVFVDALDLVPLGFERALPADTGRPAYHPSTLRGPKRGAVSTSK